MRVKGQGKKRRSGRRGGSHPAVPALAEADSTPFALHVYRCELVEERLLAVPVTSVSAAPIAAQVISFYLERADREKFVVLMLDAAGGILGIETVAVGSISRVHIEPREVFKPALLRNAERIILGHNHLRDSPEPSQDDKVLTRTLVRAGETLGVAVVDHIIVGQGKFFSFAHAGLIREAK
jgi:DNA repair protein RadC